MPTLKEVAAAAGVSTVTASSVLSGANRVRVSTETQDRIRRVAREMNYVPRAAARGLRTGRAQAIAFLTAGHTHSRWRPHWQDILRGINDVLWERDEQFLLTLSRSREHELDILRQLAFGHQVDGLLIQDLEEGDPRIDLLREANVPFVAIGGVVAPQTDIVVFDAEAFARRLMEDALREHGGVVLISGRGQPIYGDPFLRVCLDRADAAGALFRAWSGAFLPDHGWFRDAREATGEKPLNVILTRHLLPELLIRLHEGGLQNGRDVRITYLCEGEQMLAPLHGIDVVPLDFYTLGRRATQRLFRRIDRKTEEPADPVVHVFPTTLESLLPDGAPTAR